MATLVVLMLLAGRHWHRIVSAPTFTILTSASKSSPGFLAVVVAAVVSVIRGVRLRILGGDP